MLCVSLDRLLVCPGVQCGSLCPGSQWFCDYLEAYAFLCAVGPSVCCMHVQEYCTCVLNMHLVLLWVPLHSVTVPQRSAACDPVTVLWGWARRERLCCVLLGKEASQGGPAPATHRTTRASGWLIGHVVSVQLEIKGCSGTCVGYGSLLLWAST